MNKYLFLLFMFIASPSVFADCEDLVNTIEIKQCLAGEAKTIEANLLSTYKALLSKSSGALEKERLIKAQRLWVQFKEADCSSETDKDAGGTAEGIIFQGCLNEKAIIREKELRARLESY